MSHQKLNSECSFPLRLDLEPFTKQGLEAREAKRGPAPSELYELVGVVVHAGTSNFGHYFSLVKSRDGNQGWIKFNDRQAKRHPLFKTSSQLIVIHITTLQVCTSLLRNLHTITWDTHHYSTIMHITTAQFTWSSELCCTINFDIHLYCDSTAESA